MFLRPIAMVTMTATTAHTDMSGMIDMSGAPMLGRGRVRAMDPMGAGTRAIALRTGGVSRPSRSVLALPFSKNVQQGLCYRCEGKRSGRNG